MAAISATVIGAWAAAASAAVGAASAVDQSNKAKKSMQQNKQMSDDALGRERDAALKAESERSQAEMDAAAKVNSRLAARNKARQASSLLSKGTDSATSDVPALGGGTKTTLGQ